MHEFFTSIALKACSINHFKAQIFTDMIGMGATQINSSKV